MPVPSYGRSPREQSKRESRKNLKGLVRDNLHACIGLSTCNIDSNGSKFDSKTDPSCGNCSNGDLWVTNEDKCIKSNDWLVNVGDSRIQSAALRRRQSRILDLWAARQAREMITTIERQACEAELQALSSAHPVSTLASSFMRESSPARSECSIELPNLRASSLVQMWRELEAEAMSVENRTSSVNSPGSATSNAVGSIADNCSFNEEHSEYESDDRNESPVAPDDSCMDWESDAVAPRVSGSGETERGRVSDMVRRLNSGYRTTSSLTSCSDENEREQLTLSPLGVQGQTMFDLRGRSSEFHSNGNRRLIRGRQATMDLFMRIGRDRERELARLVERRTVSYFSHRSRIQVSFFVCSLLFCLSFTLYVQIGMECG